MTIKLDEDGTHYALHGRDATVHALALANNVDAALATRGGDFLAFTPISKDVMRRALRMFIKDCTDELAEPDADELKLENIRLRAQLHERIKEIDDLNNEPLKAENVQLRTQLADLQAGMTTHRTTKPTAAKKK